MKMTIDKAGYRALAVLLAAATFTYAQQAAELIQQANATQDPDAKIRLLGQAVKADGGSFASYYLLGNALRTKGQNESALQSYKQAESKAPDDQKNAMALLRQAEVCKSLGRVDEAMVHLRRSIDRFKFEEAEKLLAELRKSGATVVPAAEIARALSSKGIELDGETVAATPPKIDLPIHFEYNQAKMTPDGLSQAEQLGQALREHNRASRLTLTGHTDRRGSDEYNMALSQRRADALVDFLITRYGLDRNLLTATGMGKQQLLMQGDTEEDHRLNRRVEIKVVD
jgi:outer membrane protein OmpA-like peptidoglycan-associated protein